MSPLATSKTIPITHPTAEPIALVFAVDNSVFLKTCLLVYFTVDSIVAFIVDLPTVELTVFAE